FGDTQAASVTYVSPTSLTATSPAGFAGAVDVSVTTDSGTSATGSGDVFTYNAASNPAITSLGTSSGTTAGGTSVVLTGTDRGGAIAVDFGDNAAGFTINSGTQITATPPASSAGTVDVIVVTTAGTSAPASAARFTFSAASPPAISSMGTTTGST